MEGTTPYLKLRNGIYYVQWTEGRTPKRVSTRTGNLAEAKVFLGQWLLMDRTAKDDDRKGVELTVNDLWPYYLEHQIAGGPSERTVASLTKTIVTHFGNLTVVQITQKVVDDYLAKRTTGKLGRRVKPNSVRKELIQFAACLNYCSKPRFKQRLFDPSLFEMFDVPEQGRARDRWLRLEEMDALHKAATEMRIEKKRKRLTRTERFCWLALETAGREMALRELTWDRVHLDQGMIDLKNPARPDTFKKSATVAISDRLRPILERAYTERTNNYVLDHPGRIWENVQWAVIRAGLDPKQPFPLPKGEYPRSTGIHPHVFRHTAATHMAQAGVPLWIIANILGNTVDMVEKVYAKWQPQAARNALNSIYKEAAE